MNINSLLTPKGPKAPINKFYFTIGVLFAIIAVVGSLYLAVWLMLVGGIVQVVEACKATPVSSFGIAIGALRILGTAVAGWGSFFVSCALCGYFFRRAYAAREKQKFDHLSTVHKQFFGKL